MRCKEKQREQKQAQYKTNEKKANMNMNKNRGDEKLFSNVKMTKSIIYMNQDQEQNSTYSKLQSINQSLAPYNNSQLTNPKNLTTKQLI
jgi:hypothetical protein